MPKKKPKRVSGPSGKNTKPGILLRAEAEDFVVWREVASYVSGRSLTDWIRDTCNKEAARKLR